MNHPLRRLILLEFEERLVSTISKLVPSGKWRPSPAYSCLIEKRSGGHRQLVFPSIVDTIVGRRLIDALEPGITKDDHGQTFCGRSHASTLREPGDYESWFELWLDYTSRIAEIAEAFGYAYVLETDIANFFPSIDRERAKELLSERTKAHPSLAELLFYCLETWLPRVEYKQTTGIPIETNDISRLVAHSYLKPIDKLFTDQEKYQYFRWVDDTVMFVPTRKDAEDLRHQHCRALSELNLTPNAAKSFIVDVREYQAGRHPEENRRISNLHKTSEGEFLDLVEDWYKRSPPDTPGWDRIAKRLYTSGRRYHFLGLREHLQKDLRSNPVLTRHALSYLQVFEVREDEVLEILRTWKSSTGAQRVEIAKFLCEARFDFKASKLLSVFSVGRIIQSDNDPAADYVKGLLLLLLHKHGTRKERERVLKWGSPSAIIDQQLLLHFCYVFTCTGELESNLLDRVRHVTNSDLELALQLCAAARAGQLDTRAKLLSMCLKVKNGFRTIEARHLPFVRLVLETGHYKDSSESWLKTAINSPKWPSRKWDPVVLQFLRHQFARLKL